MGFLDKETVRKNLFQFTSPKIKILANCNCFLLILFYLSCSRGLLCLHQERGVWKLSLAWGSGGQEECPPSPGNGSLPSGGENQMVKTGGLLFR